MSYLNITDELLAVETDADAVPDFRRLCCDARQKLMAVTARVERLRSEKSAACAIADAEGKARRKNRAPMMSAREAAAWRKIVEADEADGAADKAEAEAWDLLRLWGRAS